MLNLEEQLLGQVTLIPKPNHLIQLISPHYQEQFNIIPIFPIPLDGISHILVHFHQQMVPNLNFLLLTPNYHYFRVLL